MIDRNEAIARIKKALKARSGKAWSVTGGRGTAWGWITIDAPPARRTWHFAEAAAGKDERGLPIYDEVNDPTKEFGHMSKAEREELAKLLGVDKVHYQGQSVSPDARDYYVDAAEDGDAAAQERFAAADSGFRDLIYRTATIHNKRPLQVYKMWLDYCQACSSGDQSAIWDEFLRWYDKELTAA